MDEQRMNDRTNEAGDERRRLSRRTVMGVGGVAVGAAFATPTIITVSAAAAASGGSGPIPGPNIIGNPNFDTP